MTAARRVPNDSIFLCLKWRGINYLLGALSEKTRTRGGFDLLPGKGTHSHLKYMVTYASGQIGIRAMRTEERAESDTGFKLYVQRKAYQDGAVTRTFFSLRDPNGVVMGLYCQGLWESGEKGVLEELEAGDHQ